MHRYCRVPSIGFWFHNKSRIYSLQRFHCTTTIWYTANYDCLQTIYIYRMSDREGDAGVEQDVWCHHQTRIVKASIHNRGFKPPIDSHCNCMLQFACRCFLQESILSVFSTLHICIYRCLSCLCVGLDLFKWHNRKLYSQDFNKEIVGRESDMQHNLIIVVISYTLKRSLLFIQKLLSCSM